MRLARILPLFALAVVLLLTVSAYAADAESEDVVLAYDSLSEAQKEAYDTMVEGIGEYRSTLRVNNLSRTSLNAVMSAIWCDHPEFFWLDSYSEVHLKGKSVTSVNAPKLDTDSIKERQKELEDVLLGLSFTGTPEERIRQIHDYLATTIYYDMEAPNSQTIYGALVERTCVCAGYAQSFSFLCRANGINCLYITGTTDSETDSLHAWNLVQVGGNWYYMDVTWDDLKIAGVCTYRYYLIGSETIVDGTTMSDSREADYDYGIVAETEAHSGYSDLPTTNVNYRTVSTDIYFDGTEVDHEVSLRTSDLSLVFSPDTYNALSRRMIVEGVEELVFTTHLIDSWSEEGKTYFTFDIILYIDRERADLSDYGVREGADLRFNNQALALQYDSHGELLYEDSSPYLMSGMYTLSPKESETLTSPMLIIVLIFIAIVLIIVVVGKSLYNRGKYKGQAGMYPQAANPMYCPSCGRMNAEGLSFCTGCGVRFR